MAIMQGKVRRKAQPSVLVLQGAHALHASASRAGPATGIVCELISVRCIAVVTFCSSLHAAHAGTAPTGLAHGGGGGLDVSTLGSDSLPI